MPTNTGTFAVDAEVADRRFTVDSWITGNRLRHDRTLDHTGVQDTTTVVLSAGIGPYPTGTTVQVVLESLAARLAALEQANRVFNTFRVDAFIQPHFWIDSIVKREVTGSFTIDAVKAFARSFTIDAVVFRPGTDPGAAGTRTFTINAFLV